MRVKCRSSKSKLKSASGSTFIIVSTGSPPELSNVNQDSASTLLSVQSTSVLSRDTTTDVFTGRVYRGHIRLAELLELYPVALLVPEEDA